MLTDHEINRYARQVTMPEIGEAGQEKLLRARVAIIGAGGCGSAVIAGLAGAGVGAGSGHLTLIDHDRIEISNLHRQFIHRMDKIDTPKTLSAASFIAALNPDITVHPIDNALTSQNAEHILSAHDLIMDCSDTLATRYIANDTCYHLGLPLIFGGAVRTDGQVTTLIPGGMPNPISDPTSDGTPCLRCIFPPRPPTQTLAPSCMQAGILASTTMLIGALQTAEALKYLTGIGRLLTGRLLLYDGLELSFFEMETQKSPHCSICSPPII